MTIRSAHEQIERILAAYPQGYDLTLERIRRLLEDLGNPQFRLPPTIHVAGTNGKGSAVAFSRTILECAGLAVHTHTSPHLVDWRERYRIGHPQGGRLVEDAVLSEAISRAIATNAGQPITVFELLTAVAFLLFADQPADVAVIEVGMGGRLDATNVIEHPAVSLVMPISYDHEFHLGNSIDEIAIEKAGIIKPGCPVVVGLQPYANALDVLTRTAERRHCPLSVYGRDFQARETGGSMVYEDEEARLELPLPGLPGRHQLANAAAAIRAVHVAGFRPDDVVVAKAMTAVEWPARMQRLTHGPLVASGPRDAEIWLDGGHNPGAGIAISQTLAELQERDPRPLIMIVGMLGGKDAVGYLAPFASLANHLFSVPIRLADTGIAPDAMAAVARRAGIPAYPAGSVSDALRLLRSTHPPGAPALRIFIGGSLYLAGEVLAANWTLPH